ncbi:MAG: hypothetical protein IPK67_08770 [Planctomycetes bacterium]|jgi:ABC-type dipeptide/oligopeptide/nickel transport system permease subunit|nr:hypothetical protein [Planctomycetota bacterium]
MIRFIRENWIWILAPIVIVAVVLIALAYFGGGNDDPVTPFVYPIH